MHFWFLTCFPKIRHTINYFRPNFSLKFSYLYSYLIRKCVCVCFGVYVSAFSRHSYSFNTVAKRLLWRNRDASLFLFLFFLHINTHINIVTVAYVSAKCSYLWGKNEARVLINCVLIKKTRIVQIGYFSLFCSCNFK